ncbi:hypothetical protein H8R18_03325 [Nanchangia anserum]|uniref:Uncharacterized protein n=1 Tax=Nanchangia anserum TaxID=2692125 RepID=A0A8I0KPB6_9ACTO|nr:hypothetical protein [Nanchangia anserum]MBD3690186.1 hypothetical protein [Nanchangia anserum]QOX82359.1 hypothetical protein H8R18_03325 [Nanchangia anserum]
MTNEKLSERLSAVLDEERSELAQLWSEADEDERREWVRSIEPLRIKLR